MAFNNNANYLSQGVVNLNQIRDDSRRELLDLLDKCPGTKALVWDSVLIEQISLIAEYSLLKEYDVGPMFPLRSSRLPKSNVQHIIFIVRPVLSLMDSVAINIKKEEEGGKMSRKEYHILFVPWKSFLCTQKLEELGVYGCLTNVEEYKLDVIAIESDVLSMENHSSFYDTVVDEDSTSSYLAAKAIVSIQKQYGVIPLISGKGESAKYVNELAQKMWSEEGEQPEEEPSQIDRMLVFDRQVDLITPLVTQLTYEGLIDEAFGISNTSAHFPPEKFANQSKSEDIPTEKKKISLTSKEVLYGDLRNCNFNAVGQVLKRQAKVIAEKYEEKNNLQTVGEMKQFVSQMPQLQQVKQSLATHTNIAELVKEFTESEDFLETLSTEQDFLNCISTDKVNPFIEECIYRKKPLTKVLRLLCLQCLTNNGFKPRVLDYYKHEIVQTYGYKHLITLHKLEKCGFLRLSGGNWNYNTIRKSLRLIVEDINEKEPQDIAYVHSGYAPLSVRLVQIMSNPGWRSIEEVLRMLPGPTISNQQQAKPRKKWQGSMTSDGSSSSIVTLVFFVGGVTYAELSALRYLSSRQEGFEYIAATTSMINGNLVMESLIEQ